MHSPVRDEQCYVTAQCRRYEHGTERSCDVPHKTLDKTEYTFYYLNMKDYLF